MGLFWMKHMMESDDPWAVINHQLQPWILKAHILVVPALVFVLGLIATRHIWPHARTGLRSGLRSGIITALVSVPMIVSGYLIQAITEPDWLNWIAIVHIATGFLFAGGFAVHRLRVLFRQRTKNGAAVYHALTHIQQAAIVVSSNDGPEWKDNGGSERAGSGRSDGQLS
jgi:hypothetical protein